MKWYMSPSWYRYSISVSSRMARSTTVLRPEAVLADRPRLQVADLRLHHAAPVAGGDVLRRHDPPEVVVVLDAHALLELRRLDHPFATSANPDYSLPARLTPRRGRAGPPAPGRAAGRPPSRAAEHRLAAARAARAGRRPHGEDPPRPAPQARAAPPAARTIAGDRARSRPSASRRGRRRASHSSAQRATTSSKRARRGGRPERRAATAATRPGASAGRAATGRPSGPPARRAGATPRSGPGRRPARSGRRPSGPGWSASTPPRGAVWPPGHPPRAGRAGLARERARSRSGPRSAAERSSGRRRHRGRQGGRLAQPRALGHARLRHHTHARLQAQRLQHAGDDGPRVPLRELREAPRPPPCAARLRLDHDAVDAGLDAAPRAPVDRTGRVTARPGAAPPARSTRHGAVASPRRAVIGRSGLGHS